MANYAAGARIICPYYDHEAKLSITCEGVLPGSQTLSRFREEKNKQIWQETFCETHGYCKCPLAAKLNEKYEKEGL